MRPPLPSRKRLLDSMIDVVQLIIVGILAVLEIRWFNRDIYPRWWNPFDWRV